MEQELQMMMGDSQRAQVLGRMARLASNQLQDPDRALSDGPNMIPLDQLPALMHQLTRLRSTYLELTA